MKKNIIYSLLLVVAVFFASCEDRLDIAKHGNMGGQDDFYKTNEQTEQAVAAMYGRVKGLYFNWFFTKNMLSDDAWCGGGSRGDNNSYEQLNEFTFDSSNSNVEGLFQGLYGVIYQSNLIIEKVADDTEVKKRAIAEAYFFRAWANFELVTLWGTAPLVDHLLATDEYRQPNSTPEALWAVVESDLKEAISMNALPSKKNKDDQETGMRVTQEVAKAYLGKAYLFQKKYREAASALNEVVDSKKYDLFRGDYDMQFHAVNNNNCESMLELQWRNDQEQAWNQFDMTFLMQGWRTGNMTLEGKAANEVAQGTYGFLNPRKSLYEAFVKAEGENGYRLQKTLLNSDQMTAYGVKLNPGKNIYGCEGYLFFKNRILKSDNIMDASYFQGLQYTDRKIMRYAEVLLLAAEANLEAGNPDVALKDINEIRLRAKETPLTSVTLNDIKTEKRLELCLESTRFQDLVRWGDAKNALASQGKEIPNYSSKGVSWDFTNSTFGFQDKHMLLPIPLKERELNPNIQQNTGW